MSPSRPLLAEHTARSVRAIAIALPLVFAPSLFRSETRLPAPSASCSHGVYLDSNEHVTCAGSRPAPAAVSLLFGVRPDLNEMSAQELAMVPGIGEKLALRIVTDRDQHGRFRSIEEVDRVKGIGPALTKRISEYVRVR